MDTGVLRWFQQVADGATVTEVSEIYMVSQPGVSRALARLEEEVGTPLLQRSGRVLRMTRAGAALKRHVDALINELDDGLAAVHQLVDPETGTVTVAFQLSLGTWFVPAVIAGFRAVHPSVEFVLEPSRDELGSALVSGGRVDIEVTARRPRNPAVRWRRLFAEPLYLAVSSQHRLAGAETVALADVAAEPFVALRPGWLLRDQVDGLCGAAGFSPRLAFEADDLPTVRGFVAAGLGVAILPAMGEDPVSVGAGGVRLIAVSDIGAERDVGVAWSLERRLLPSAELFRKHLLARTSLR
jgi:DNA-binding transcriptional LysR family regulator